MVLRHWLWFGLQTRVTRWKSHRNVLSRSSRAKNCVWDGLGGDDQKLFAFLRPDEFIITATHLERVVEVHDPRNGGWYFRSCLVSRRNY